MSTVWRWLSWNSPMGPLLAGLITGSIISGVVIGFAVLWLEFAP